MWVLLSLGACSPGKRGPWLVNADQNASERPSGLSEQPPFTWVSSKYEGGGRCLAGSRVIGRRGHESLGESRPPPKKARTKGCLSSSARYVYVDGGLLCGLSLLVPDHFDGFFLNRKHTLGVLNFRRSMTRPEPPTSLSSSETARVGALGRPDSISPREVVTGDVPPTHGPLDTTVLGDLELGMPGFPRTPSLSADRGQVTWSTELACSQVASTCRLLLETLVTVG
jgi:hypothetical protein